ncbi:hypothetical protein K0M31_007282 [Melipona bicolor]|uniref:Uncharacterized protein n=1 Tax=Melipona bicolor TaxID=60889 RepID=A0AA40GBC9_9HYME|nr:hypothetical protein K0M31_007282 [Melipona bicolor]
MVADCSSILVAVVVIVAEVRSGRSSLQAPADGIIAGRPSRALQTICGKKGAASMASRENT